MQLSSHIKEEKLKEEIVIYIYMKYIFIICIFLFLISKGIHKCK